MSNLLGNTMTTEANLELYKQLDKELGKLCKGAYSGKGNKSIEVNTDFVLTLSDSFNSAFGGIAPGRIYELFGPEGSSKSTLALFITRSMQAEGKTVVWLDIESTFTEDYAEKCGVDVEELIFMRPDTMNEAMEVIRAVSKSELVDLVVIDSVAAMSPADDFDRDMGSSVLATKARMLSQALPQLIAHCKRSGCTLLFINQERAFNFAGYGPKTTTTGGNALPYYSSVRIKMTRTGTVDSKGQTVGMKYRADAKKNKVWYPFGSYEFQVRLMSPEYDNCGLDLEYDLYRAACDRGLVEKKGAWFSFGDFKIQGEEAFISRIRDDEDFRETIKEALNASQEDSQEYDSGSAQGEEE